jgi:hypothetical protein
MTKTTKTLPGFVEIAPGRFIAIGKLTVGQIRGALVTEHMATEEAGAHDDPQYTRIRHERFGTLFWLRRHIPADAQDSDLVLGFFHTAGGK